MLTVQEIIKRTLNFFPVKIMSFSTNLFTGVGKWSATTYVEKSCKTFMVSEK